jgi:flagella basal body P-ring formation protein FlgA
MVRLFWLLPLCLLSSPVWSFAGSIVSFSDSPVHYCGRILTWQPLLPDLSAKDTDCLDLWSPFQEKTDSLTGERSTLERELLAGILKTAKGECLKNKDLMIPAQVQLNRETQLNEKVLRPWLLAQLQLEFPTYSIEVSSLQVPRIDCLKVGIVKWGSFRREGRNHFRMLVMVDDHNFNVTGEFQLHQMLPTLVRNLVVGERIQPGDLEFRKKNVTFSPGFIERAEEVVGRIVHSPLLRGEPIQVRQLKPENMVEKGQIVQVQVRNENFVLSSMGIAEQSGSLGDLIRIKSMDSQKLISGFVSGKGQAEVR